MMNFFSKKKKPKEDHPCLVKMAECIVQVVTVMQQRWACWMQNKAQSLSRRTLRGCLIGFVTLGTGLSLNIMVKNFHSPDSHPVNIRRLLVPAHASNISSEKYGGAHLLHEQEKNSIKKFKNYLDSLRNTKTGKEMLDSLQMVRPGLLDSLQQLDILYPLPTFQKR